MPRTLIKPERAIKSKSKQNKAAAYTKLTAKNIKPRFAILSGLCLLVLGLSVFGVITLLRNQSTSPQELPPVPSSISVPELPDKGTAMLKIDNIHVAYDKDTGITISWITDKEAYGEIEYWASDLSEKRTISGDALASIHVFNISGVEVDKLYYYRVVSRDTSGNKVTSEEKTFTFHINLAAGAPAPDFTLQSLNGTSVTLSSYRGKPVMLYFWLISCSACREKLPVVQEALEKLPQGKIAIFAIHPKADQLLIQNFIAKEKITFTVLLDPEGSVKQLYKVQVPTANFIIDNNGTISEVNAHFHNAGELESIFSDLLSTQ